MTTAPARSYPVVEHFVSVNGEGPRAGQLAAFVRFRGCALACSYCDTVWANSVSSPATPMTAREIVDFVEQSGVRCVTLTGGEPLMQEGIDELLQALAADSDRFIEIETNGAVPLAFFAKLRRELRNRRGDAHAGWHFTMDYKLPSSGMEERMLVENFQALDAADTVKFVIGTSEDFPVAAARIREYGLEERCQVHLSPVHGQMSPADIVDFMRREGLAQAQLHLQLHKLVWPDVERGV